MANEILVKFTITAKRTFKALQEGWPIIVNEGGARCFYPGQKVVTEFGSKPISQIKPGDKVLSHSNGKDEMKLVTAIHRMVNEKKSVRVKLKNGEEIICTEDHKFYFSGRWVELKDLLSLPHVYSKKL